MVSKIEAAERMAKMVERYNQEHGVLGWRDVVDALDAYRSASVPSDEDLGLVAYSTTGLTAKYEWNDLTDVQRRKWSEAAAAVREWVQRGLTDEEREAVIALVDCHLANAELRASILRKLGHEREPVWEWDEANATMTLGGKFSDGVFPCAAVSLFYGGGLLCRIHLSEMKELHQVLDNYAESLEWCEQQLREARQ